MNNSDRRLFIFDWDGTLCDSTRTIIAAIQAAADDTDLPRLADAEVMNIIGLALTEAFTELYPQMTAAHMDEMKRAYRRRYSELSSEPVKLFPGVKETIASLAAAGHLLAIATSKSRAGLTHVLRSIEADDWFHGSRCADESASKPDPLMLYQLLDQFQVASHQAVMIGDTEYDMEMARRAGIERIAVDYGAHCVSRLQPYEPVMSVSRVEEILAFIDRDICV